VSTPEFIPPKWRKPAPLGYSSAMDSLGAVAAPLLAGFSLATVVIVSDDAASFRWPGGVLLALAIAAVAFVGSVQCAYNSRQYIWSAADVADWWPEAVPDSQLELLLRDEQATAFGRWQVWVRCTRWSYDAGILALLAGLGLGLAPATARSAEAGLRWAAAGVAFAACTGELAWIVLASWKRLTEGRAPAN
jgi:hypothetical protein